MFAFLRGSNWISPSSFREIFNVFPYWKPKSRDFKVVRNYLGFFWDWTSFSPRGFFLCSIFGKNVLVVLKLSLSICRPDFFYLICSLSLFVYFCVKPKIGIGLHFSFFLIGATESNALINLFIKSWYAAFTQAYLGQGTQEWTK